MVYTDFLFVCVCVCMYLLAAAFAVGVALPISVQHSMSFVTDVQCCIAHTHYIRIFRERSAMENTFDGIALNTILIDIMKCILFNKI